MLRKAVLTAALCISQLTGAQQVLEQEAALSQADQKRVQKYTRSQVNHKQWHPRERPQTKTRHLQGGDFTKFEDPAEPADKPTRDICSLGINRLKNNQIDVSRELIRGADNNSFTDETFTFPRAITWPELPGEYEYASHVNTTSWSRIKNKFGDEKFSMWGESVQPEDAIQGGIGNCWLISAAMSLAESESRLTNFFLVDEKNSASIYAANLYLLGTPITVAIDDFVPLALDSIRQTIYAKVGKDGAIWGLLFEKLYAKYFGNYEMIDAGHAAIGIEVASGSPFTNVDHIFMTPENAEKLWIELYRKERGGVMVTSGSYTGTGSDQDQNFAGLPFNHAFSIEHAIELTKEDGEKVRLLMIRNPWGLETYKGNYSDSDLNWTDSMLEQAFNKTGHIFGDDGQFFMLFDDYVAQMEYTDFSWDISQSFQSSFILEGDDEPVNRVQLFDDDPTEYNVHHLRVKSAIDQEFQISVHTYNIKHYHGACTEIWQYESDYSEVLYGPPGVRTLQTVNPGSHHDEKKQIKAGEELVYKIYTRFVEEDLLPHDWSFIAWGSAESLSIDYVDAQGSLGNLKSVNFDVQGQWNGTIPTNFPEQEPEVPIEEFEDFDWTWPLNQTEIAMLQTLRNITLTRELPDEAMAMKEELESRLNTFLDNFGIYYMTKDEALVWMAEELELEKLTPSREELLRLEELLSQESDGILDEDTMLEFWELKNKLHAWKFAAFEWMYSDEQMTQFLLGYVDFSVLPTRLDILIEMRDVLSTEAQRIRDGDELSLEDALRIRELSDRLDSWIQYNEPEKKYDAEGKLAMLDELIKKEEEYAQEGDNGDDWQEETKPDWDVGTVIDLTGHRGLHMDLRLLDVGFQNNTLNFTGYSYNDTWKNSLSLDNKSIVFDIQINDDGLTFDFVEDEREREFQCSWNKTICVGSLKVGDWLVKHEFQMGNSKANVTTDTLARRNKAESSGHFKPQGFISFTKPNMTDGSEAVIVQIGFDFDDSETMLKIFSRDDAQDLLYKHKFNYDVVADMTRYQKTKYNSYTMPENKTIVVRDNISDFAVQKSTYTQRNHSLYYNEIDQDGNDNVRLNQDLIYVFGPQRFSIIMAQNTSSPYITCIEDEEFVVTCSEPVDLDGFRYTLDIDLMYNAILNVTSVSSRNRKVSFLTEFSMWTHKVNRTDDFGMNGSFMRKFDLRSGSVSNTTELDINRNMEVFDITEGARESFFANVSLTEVMLNHTVNSTAVFKDEYYHLERSIDRSSLLTKYQIQTEGKLKVQLDLKGDRDKYLSFDPDFKEEKGKVSSDGWAIEWVWDGVAQATFTYRQEEIEDFYIVEKFNHNAQVQWFLVNNVTDSSVNITDGRKLQTDSSFNFSDDSSNQTDSSFDFSDDSKNQTDSSFNSSDDSVNQTDSNFNFSDDIVNQTDSSKNQIDISSMSLWQKNFTLLNSTSTVLNSTQTNETFIYKFDDVHYNVTNNLTSFTLLDGQDIMTTQTVQISRQTTVYPYASAFSKRRTKSKILEQKITHILNADNYAVIIGSHMLQCIPQFDSRKNCTESVVIDDWEYNLIEDSYSVQLVISNRNASHNMTAPIDLVTQIMPDKILLRDVWTDQTLNEREPRNGTFHLNQPLEVIDITGEKSMHVDVRIRNAGEQNHHLNITGYSFNDTWRLNRTLDQDWLAYQVNLTENGFNYTFKAETDGVYQSYQESGGFNCSWEQSNCTGNVTIGRFSTYFHNLTYKYDPETYTVEFSYNLQNQTDIRIYESAYFGGNGVQASMWINDTTTGEMIWYKWTEVVTPHDGEVWSANEATEYNFETSNITVYDNFTDFRLYYDYEEEQSEPTSFMTNQTLTVVESKWSGRYKTKEVLLNSTFVYTSNLDGPIVTIYPEDNSVHFLQCKLTYEGMTCPENITHRNWNYTLALDFFPNDLEDPRIEAVLSVVNANATKSVSNHTMPLAFTTHWKIDLSGENDNLINTVERTDFFSDANSTDREIIFEKTWPTAVPVPNVTDLTGDYILHQDVRMTNVGRQNQTVNMTAYSTKEGDWTVHRTIDNSTFVYMLQQASEKEWSFDFIADNQTMRVSCQLGEDSCEQTEVKLGSWVVYVYSATIEGEFEGLEIYYRQNNSQMWIFEAINFGKIVTVDVTIYSDMGSRYETYYENTFTILSLKDLPLPVEVGNSKKYDFDNGTSFRVDMNYTNYGLMSNQTFRIINTTGLINPHHNGGPGGDGRDFSPDNSRDGGRNGTDGGRSGDGRNGTDGGRSGDGRDGGRNGTDGGRGGDGRDGSRNGTDGGRDGNGRDGGRNGTDGGRGGDGGKGGGGRNGTKGGGDGRNLQAMDERRNQTDDRHNRTQEMRNRTLVDTKLIYVQPDLYSRGVILQTMNNTVHSLICRLPGYYGYDYGYGYYEYYNYDKYQTESFRRQLQDDSSDLNIDFSNSTDDSSVWNIDDTNSTDNSSDWNIENSTDNSSDWNDSDSTDNDWVERNWQDENSNLNSTFYMGYKTDCSDSIVLDGWNYTYAIAGPFETLQVEPESSHMSKTGEPEYFQTSFNLWDNTITQKNVFKNKEPDTQIFDLTGKPKINAYISQDSNEESSSQYSLSVEHEYFDNTQYARMSQIVQEVNDTSVVQEFTLFNATTQEEMSFFQILHYNNSDEAILTVQLHSADSDETIERSFTFGNNQHIESEYHLSDPGKLSIKMWSGGDNSPIEQAIWFEELGITIQQYLNYDQSGIGSWKQVIQYSEWPIKPLEPIFDDYWSFYTLSVPMFEPVPQFDEESYDDGFDAGYQSGYSAGEEEFSGPQIPDMDPDVLQVYVDNFSDWVEMQNMVPSSFDCDSDIRISYPFPNDENMWAFWAAHDCTDYSLLLTLVFSEESIAKVVGFHGAELSSKGCSASTAFNGAFTCEFELDIARQGFGLLFMGGFTPVFHLTEWQQETDWEDTFNWW